MLGIALIPGKPWRLVPCLGLAGLLGCSQTTPAEQSMSLLPDMVAEDAGADAAVPPADLGPPPPPCPFPTRVSAGFPALPDISPTRMWSAGLSDLWMIGPGGSDPQGVALHFDGTAFKPPVGLPATRGLGGISGSGPDDVWMTTAEGSFLHFDGKTWTTISATPGQPLGDVWAPRKDRVWALSGKSLVSWDGTTLHIETSPGADTPTALWGVLAPDGSAEIWATGTGSKVFYNKSPGGTFAQIPGPAASGDATAIWASGSYDIWVLAPGPLGPTFHYDSMGWKNVRFPSGLNYGTQLYSLWGSSPSDVWIGGFAGTQYVNPQPNGAFHWDGTDTVWSQVALTPATWPQLVTGNAVGDVWTLGRTYAVNLEQGYGYPSLFHGDKSGLRVVGGVIGGAVLGSSPDSLLSLGTPAPMRWNGTAWSVTSLPFSASENAVVQFKPDDAWYSGPQGTEHWDGTKWTVMSSLVGILGGNTSGELWLWQGPQLAHWDGTSFVFESCTLAAGGSYLWRAGGVISGGPGDVWILGNDQAVKGEGSVAVHRTPTGCAQAAAPPDYFHPLASWASSAADVWSVGHGGLPYYSSRVAHFDGTAWTLVDTGISDIGNGFTGVWGFAKSDVWAATADRTAHWDGTAWTVGACGDQIIHVGSSPKGHWALTRSSQILTE